MEKHQIDLNKLGFLRLFSSYSTTLVASLAANVASDAALLSSQWQKLNGGRDTKS